MVDSVCSFKNQDREPSRESEFSTQDSMDDTRLPFKKRKIDFSQECDVPTTESDYDASDEETSSVEVSPASSNGSGVSRSEIGFPCDKFSWSPLPVVGLSAFPIVSFDCHYSESTSTESGHTDS